MTTNINLFDIVNNNDLTVDKFAKVCVKMSEGMALYKQTQTIYEFLKAHRGNEFTCTEIGLALGYPFSWHCNWDNTEEAYVKKISDSLYWLLEMGLVHRNTYTKRITVECGYPHKVRDVKIIDGVEYVGYVLKYDEREVDSKTHKWSAL